MKKIRFSGEVLGIFLAMLILLGAITAYVESNRLSQQQEQMKYIASTVSAETYEILSAQLSKAKTLQALIIRNNGGVEGFSSVAGFLASEEGVRNVLLAPDGVVSEVYPLKGNEDVVGHNLLGSGAGDKEAQLAVEQGKMTMAGPFELVQGGTGIAARLPVYLSGKFWGIVSVTLDSPDVLAGMSAMQNLSRQGFGCTLWHINVDTGGPQTILSTGTAAKVDSCELAFSIFNAEWHVTVFPVKPWYAHVSLWCCAAATLALSFGAAVAASNKLTIRKMDGELAEYRIRELQTQLERDRANILLTQINSHFFYHTLNVIQALIALEPDSAYKMTEDFSRFLRFKVDSVGARHGLVPFKEEMRCVQAYADINAVQLGARLKMEYDIFDADFMIPALTVQPAVENAIDHGIKPSVIGGTVRVHLRKEGGFYTVSIEDNGAGFTPGGQSRQNSVGMANVRTRMEDYPGCSISIRSAPGKGTTVILRYPGDLSEACET